MPKIPLHFMLAEEVLKLMAQGSYRKIYQDRLDNGTILQVESDVKGFSLPGEIFIASADIYDNLSAAAIKLIIDIQKQLQMNNPLWCCDPSNSSRLRSAIAQLKKNNILKPIAGTDIFIVNPAKIRKGRPLAVYAALYSYSKRMYKQNPKWKPTTQDIKRLLSPKEIELENSLVQEIDE